MNSHLYAERLKDLAEFLLSKPEFETNTKVYMLMYQSDKEKLVQAVKAIGAGTKTFTDNEFKFAANTLPEGIELRISAPRNLVCKLVAAAKYDCEPLLSPDEVTAL